jgi:signal transduction histidine kinase
MVAIVPEFCQSFSGVEVSDGIRQNAAMNALDLKRAASPAALRAALVGGLFLSVSGRTATEPGATPLPCLTSVRQVRDVPPEEAARGYPVRLRGVVTYCDATSDWGMFLQDATGGIFVKLGEGTNLNVGDEIEVNGASGAGDFVPLVVAGPIKLIGRRGLPEPARVTYEQLASGKEDSQWVEVRGEVRSIVPSAQGHTRLDLLMEGNRLNAVVTHFNRPESEKLIAATVRVRGVCRTRFNNKRQMCAPFISVTDSDDIAVETAAPGEAVTVPLTQLLRFKSEGYFGRRVKVRGVVTAQTESSVFIQEGGDGLCVKTYQTNRFIPGDVVEVTGFPLVGQYGPLFEDALVRLAGHRTAPLPINVRIGQLASEDYEGELVRVRGILMNRVRHAGEEVLVVEGDNLILNARLDAAKADVPFHELEKGSQIELTGVCLTQPVENWNPSVPIRPESFQLFLRSANDVVVIENPPWWTLARLLWMLGMMSVVLLAGFAWVFVLNGRVRRQTAIIQQKIQREAVLEERTRIAREFHDTLEQELVAITIQLETVAAQFDQAPGVARQMLELARNMSRRSLSEARRSVWDLRSHLLENSSLVMALSEVAKLMASGAHAAISVETSGTLRKLPPQMENNLLRIAQEALANALKHARAARIAVHLDYEPEKVSLRVTDDGAGFDTGDPSVIYRGHFGLLDMSERVEKMGGRYAMISAPGQGTEIRVEVAEKEQLAASSGAAAKPEMQAAG